MSKTTEKYGKPKYIFSTATRDNQPNPRLLRQWARLDYVAKKQFNKQYDALNDKEKTELHLMLALQREQSKLRRAEKDAA